MEQQSVRQAVAVVFDGGNNVYSCSIMCYMQHVPGSSFLLCSITHGVFFSFLLMHPCFWRYIGEEVSIVYSQGRTCRLLCALTGL
jgi:hypothetical protein